MNNAQRQERIADATRQRDERMQAIAKADPRIAAYNAYIQAQTENLDDAEKEAATPHENGTFPQGAKGNKTSRKTPEVTP